MKSKTSKIKILPVRLEGELLSRLEDFQARTNLSKNYIIRQSINYTLKKIHNNEANIFTAE
ncbi:MAG: hypothetical protein LBD30_05240 [Verrucomicrobiales bacterium]|jgi:predicted DNA-binding protein|nr:hypothetical protein [Verrucomicrobiales bacterium]